MSERTTELVDYVGANELERATMEHFGQMTSHGFGFVDIIVRKEGKETRLQGDWLARLFREPSVLRALSALSAAELAQTSSHGIGATSAQPLISSTK